MSPLVSALPIAYLHEYYGTVAWSVRAIFDGYLGWFSGNASDLFPLPLDERAKRFVDLAGGEQRLTEKAHQAVAKEDYQWALELTDQLLRIKPDISLTVDSTVWKEVVTGFRNPAIALVKDVDKEGGTLKIIEFLSLFKPDD